MNTKKIAVISDIHGNSVALREVLADIRKRGIEQIINLGDSLYGPLDPSGTYELLREQDMISVSGNQDRFILENLNNKTDMPTLEYVKSALNKNMIDWLNALPFDITLDDKIYGCHGSPQSDAAYLLEDLKKDTVDIKAFDELSDLLKAIKTSIVLCGHSHVARIVNTGDKTIINPGSVGLPAYDDDLPVYHKIENFNPCTTYTILYLSDDLMKTDQVSLAYDFEKAAQWAEQNDRADWAQWIRTGRV